MAFILIFTTHGWTNAEDLWLTDSIRAADGTWGRISGLRERGANQRMYNLTVDEAHTFFVGDGQWLVHNACVGKATSKDYKTTFFTKHPQLKGQVVVHHGIEQQILTRYPNLFTWEEIHSLENLRGIPKNINSDVHLSQIRKKWNAFYNDFSVQNPPTRQQVLDKATEIDQLFGSQFNPPK